MGSVSSDLEDVNVENETILGSKNIPPTAAHCIPMRKDPIQPLDSMTYKSDLIKTWEQDPSQQKGFNWEIENCVATLPDCLCGATVSEYASRPSSTFSSVNLGAIR